MNGGAPNETSNGEQRLRETAGDLGTCAQSRSRQLKQLRLRAASWSFGTAR